MATFTTQFYCVATTYEGGRQRAPEATGLDLTFDLLASPVRRRDFVLVLPWSHAQTQMRDATCGMREAGGGRVMGQASSK